MKIYNLILLMVDIDGDGKPDLNIDTDNDGKPDLNLVILKKGDWKPTKCVKADIDNGILEEYCTGTSVKAVINVDTDGDGIANDNIDTNGDMKANINIIPTEEGQLTLNILPIEEWKPSKNYTHNKFSYDTMEWKMPILNYDSDGDGRADINIDFDRDGIPDINIDSDYDGIPDLNIDSDGDGYPDYNIDEDGSGIPTKNLITITEWKPEVKGDREGIGFGTMDVNEKEEPSDPAKGNHDTSVKGQYNPATSMGGANTGDNTNLIYYATICYIALSTVIFVIYKKSTNN